MKLFNSIVIKKFKKMNFSTKLILLLGTFTSYIIYNRYLEDKKFYDKLNEQYKYDKN